MNRRVFTRMALAALGAAALGGAGLLPRVPRALADHSKTGAVMEKIHKSETEWRAQLTEEQFYILREKGTEAPFKNKYDKFYEPGVYECAGCGLELFSSKAKFDSGTGWPSFWEPIDPGHIALEEDRVLFITRTEVLCARCDGHQGHVFEDGPPPTGLRYCINSAALTFVPEKGTDGAKS